MAASTSRALRRKNNALQCGNPGRNRASGKSRSTSECTKTMSDNLTRMERLVLDGVLEYLRNKEIAARLNMSVSAVKFHIGNIFAKTGAHSREELFARKSSGGARLEWHKLTEYEQRIARMTVTMERRAIAAAVGVSVTKLHYHLTCIYRILEVRGRTQLAAYLGRHNLLAEAIPIRRKTDAA
jgi:DNA-binding CsgD family transcriptional regulator